MNDQHILLLLRQGQREKALREAYQNFPKVRQFLLKQGASEEESKDLFQESLIIFYRKAQNPDFTLSSSLNTYLTAICKNLWLKKLRDDKESPSEELPESGEVQEPLEDDKQFLQGKVVAELLKDLGQRCLEVLKGYYYQALSMNEIAETFGFSSAKIAKNQKYKCLERAKKMTAERFAHLKQDLL